VCDFASIIKKQKGDFGSMKIKTFNNRIKYFLKTIFENDYLTFEDMILLVNNNFMAYLYLDFVKEKGLIETFKTQAKPEVAHCLNEWGYKILKLDGLIRHRDIFKPSQYKLIEFLTHEEKARIGIILQKHPDVVDYMTKKVIKYQKPELTKYDFDGLVITKDNKQIAVKVQIETIEIETYQKKFFDLANCFDVNLIMWFITDENLKDRLITLLKSLSTQISTSKHVLCVIDDFLTNWFYAKFYDVNGKINLFVPIDQKELKKINRQKQKRF
jgi:hypothetical protein